LCFWTNETGRHANLQTSQAGAGPMIADRIAGLSCEPGFHARGSRRRILPKPRIGLNVHYVGCPQSRGQASRKPMEHGTMKTSPPSLAMAGSFLVGDHGLLSANSIPPLSARPVSR